jgi:hypothetical protein
MVVELPNASSALLDGAASAGPVTAGASTGGDALSSSEVLHLMQCCTAVTLPNVELHQPRFVYGFHRTDAPALPVCAPCAHTCFGMKNIYVMELAVLERKFMCACRTCTVKVHQHERYWHDDPPQHECFWADDPAIGGLNRAERRQLRAAWATEHRGFVDNIKERLDEGRAPEWEELNVPL